MISRSIKSNSALSIRTRLCVRWNSSAGAGASAVHPVSQLSRELTKELADRRSSLAAFDLFKTKVQDLSQTLSDSQYTLPRSFGLNSALTQLLQTSKAELAGRAGFGSSSADSGRQLPPDPFEILTFMCEYGLARDSHFQVVMEHLVAANRPQEVLGLWVKYLETLAENPKTVTYGSHHSNNVALASVGYLQLPGNSPKLAELAQILNLADKEDQIPILRIRYLVDTLKLDAALRASVIENFGALLLEFAHVCRAEFQRQLLAIEQVGDLQKLFAALTSAAEKSSQGLDASTVALFMDAFIGCKKPQQAIKCFNVAKEKDCVDEPVKNSLLLAVANLPVYGKDVRDQKAKRIEAVWNSYVAAVPEKISVGSYIALLAALGESRNFNKLQQLWNNEIPKELKSDQDLLETYLLFQFYKRDFSFENVRDQIPERLRSIKLANEILFKMAQEKVPENIITEFYRQQFVDASAPLKPDSKTLALKMYINSLYTKDPEFQFMKSISKSKNDVNTTNSIFKRFAEFCPDIEITRKLFGEIKYPLDSRKYGYMISAESKAGDIAACEEIFKKFVQETKNPSTITRAILDPIIDAACEQCIAEKSAASLEKVHIYATFAKKAQKSLSYQSASKIIHSLALLVRNLDGKLAPQQIEAVEKLLNDVRSVKNFSPSSRDIETLTRYKVPLPDGMQH
ncbi:LAQU0S01e15478g1_1 [Lachancea quebecensis]|uniref:LAQU0S01e15478g1_1 n=1 Tax=Lachancea quebecensis TaxID=1654605 RepID=A0A0P1KLK9_9SACH|nr:LAQU0S01e15478g1_1 [Lachancea quebecensis]